VTVTLPAGSEGPLLLKKLETRLSDYSQSVADLQDSVLFDEISLGSLNGQLAVQVRSTTNITITYPLTVANSPPLLGLADSR
jgi:hypothetical protein